MQIFFRTREAQRNFKSTHAKKVDNGANVPKGKRYAVELIGAKRGK